MMLKIIFNII